MQAVFGTYAYGFPAIFLSGFIFPIRSMPAPIQALTYAVPARYYLVIVRGIFLKGVGLEAFWRDALLMAVWGVSVLTLATMRSKKTLA